MNKRKMDGSLAELLRAEEKKLENLLKKRKEIEAEIKITRSNVDRYKMMHHAEQFNSLSNALDAKGVSVEDILNAIANGDFLSLQEKVDGIQENE